VLVKFLKYFLKFRMDIRNSLILKFLCYSLSISGATFYVSPSVRDSYRGTGALPFFKRLFIHKALRYGIMLIIIELLNLSNPDKLNVVRFNINFKIY